MTAWETLEQDTVIGGAYRIVRLLGRGGSGEVYEALHERTGASLAIKILRAGFSGKTELLARFQREAEVTSRLHHPNIVKVFDFDCLPDGRPFLAMELLTGKDLGTILRSKQPLPLEQVLDIVDQVALALATTHGAGVVHRDLSPGNIFIEHIAGSNREIARVLDFGISKVRDAGSGLTHTTTIMGTPYYMSPEQAQGHARETDARADQFALAAIVYEMLTGRRAFSSDDPTTEDPATAILYRVVHHHPPSFASLGIDIPASIEEVVFKGLAKDPAERYRSIVHFADALLKAARDEGFEFAGGDAGSSTMRGALALEASATAEFGPPRRRSPPSLARATTRQAGARRGVWARRRVPLLLAGALVCGVGGAALFHYGRVRASMAGGEAAAAAPRPAATHISESKPAQPGAANDVEAPVATAAGARAAAPDDAPPPAAGSTRSASGKGVTAKVVTKVVTRPAKPARPAKQALPARESARMLKRRPPVRHTSENAPSEPTRERARPRNEDIY
jgi:serine/threonine-protein kinase